jgi:hypothetical protein
MPILKTTGRTFIHFTAGRVHLRPCQVSAAERLKNQQHFSESFNNFSFFLSPYKTTQGCMI